MAEIDYKKRCEDEINERKRAYQKEYSRIHSEKKKKYAKEHHIKNREKALEYRRQRYLTYNREEQLEKRRKWYRENKERHAANREKYEKENKSKLRAARRKWENERLSTDMNYKLQKSLAKRIRNEMKGISPKDEHTENIIGCSIENLKMIIESQFQDGMTWENWNSRGWHLDHKIPVSWFNLKSEGCMKSAFSHKNLQPLQGGENIKKKNFYSHPTIL